MAEYEWKPVIEETWTGVYDDVYSDDGQPEAMEDDWVLAFEGAIGVDKGSTRVRLAQCAPEMARLLLRFQADYAGTVHFDEIEAVLRRAGVAS